MQGVKEHQFSGNDRSSLEVDGLPAVVLQIAHDEHGLVRILSDL